MEAFIQNRRNILIARLSADDLAALSPSLETIGVKARQRLETSRTRIDKVYFLGSGFASTIIIGPARDQAEVGLLGSEGMTGLPLLYGLERSQCDIVMQQDGSALQIDAKVLLEKMAASLSLRSALLAFAYAAVMQSHDTALVNALGSVEQRLARWLLMADDRLDGEIVITHADLGHLLGVRRASVTLALRGFETSNLIHARRGMLRINSRAGLTERSGGFYRKAA